MKTFLKLFLIFLISSQIRVDVVFGQTDTSGQSNVFELSIDEIINQKQKSQTSENQISTVSSRAETNFEVPVGASVVSKEMIMNAGCLTLPEALRLMPGVLVRETSPGNFDIRIRGFAGSPPAQDFTTNTENMILVMIDNRPVYNYFSGGTFWESLPIDINDIERIELVRGPAAALYGPNAAMGVIHFITQRSNQNGVYTRANLNFGNATNLFFNTTLGYRFNEKLDIGVSSNFGHLHRLPSSQFYSLFEKRYVDTELGSIIGYQTRAPLTEEREAYGFPSIDESLIRFAFNGFLEYIPTKDWAIDLRFGVQESTAIYPVSENTYIPLSTVVSETQYLNFKSKLFDSNLQFSYMTGEQEPGRGFLGGAYDFGLMDFNLDYDFKFGNFFLKPAINYRQAVYDDTEAGEDKDFVADSRILQGKSTLSNLGLSLRADYQLKNLRLIAALRQDKFNVQSAPFYGYQLAITYQIKQKHLLRMSYGKANRSLFITDVFTNYVDRNLLPSPSPPFQNISFGIQGNANVDLPALTSAEVGYRVKLNDKWSGDIEFFYAQGSNFLSRFVNFLPLNQSTLLLNFTTQNDLLSSTQTGSTFSLEYTGQKNQLRFFLNLQWTDLQNFSPFDNEADKSKNYDIRNYRATPNWFGGIYWNHHFSSKWRLNLNTYFFGNHEIWHRTERTFLQTEFEKNNFVRSGIGADVKAKVIFNAKLMFSPVKQLTTFVNVRNLFDQTGFEYYFTDKVGIGIMGGVNFRL
ncbi:MAG: TonB-dependent receptor plug domain-containing protein [Microscillaceae bacterium]|jgi:iron complex outermembrane receptor protein|nr:TonB-dependent receptor plug domain-containing protein [Microscillaceae bacterium]